MTNTIATPEIVVLVITKDIFINGEKLETMNSFEYLSEFLTDGNGNKEIKRRANMAL
uniref:Uncharacterized protein n=1 Tax=Arion vulgaris TaxID=1028688 RepID=A0A0B7AXS1_9EUPU